MHFRERFSDYGLDFEEGISFNNKNYVEYFRLIYHEETKTIFGLFQSSPSYEEVKVALNLEIEMAEKYNAHFVINDTRYGRFNIYNIYDYSKNIFRPGLDRANVRCSILLFHDDITHRIASKAYMAFLASKSNLRLRSILTTSLEDVLNIINHKIGSK